MGQIVVDLFFQVVLKNIEKLINFDGYVFFVMFKGVMGMDEQVVSIFMKMVYIWIYISVFYISYMKFGNWFVVD